jgi:hypothetical protein
MSLLIHLIEGATVFAIKYLADRAAQVVFADFGTFMLERTVKSIVDPDDCELQESAIPDRTEFRHAAVEKLIVRGDDRRYGKVAKLVDLEMRLSSSYLH